MQTRSFVLGLGLGLLHLLVACAEVPDEGDESGRFDEVTSTPATSADKNADAGSDLAATPTGEGSTPAPTPGTAPAPPPAAPAPPPATDPGRTCQTARDLGALSGDTGTRSISAQGFCSDWLRVRVTEDWRGPTGGMMKVTATLISPDREDFDVIVYLNAASDVLECTTAMAKSELPAGRSDVARASWGERYTFNSGDDSRTVSVRIKKKSGTCSNQPWSLLLQGNY
jgi:hypothetical protein